MTQQVKQMDLGRWVQLVLLVITLATVFVGIGRVLTQFEAMQRLIDEKDRNRDRDFDRLEKQLDSTKEKADRLERLFLVKFGAAGGTDPTSKEK